MKDKWGGKGVNGDDDGGEGNDEMGEDNDDKDDGGDGDEEFNDGEDCAAAGENVMICLFWRVPDESCLFCCWLIPCWGQLSKEEWGKKTLFV